MLKNFRIKYAVMFLLLPVLVRAQNYHWVIADTTLPTAARYDDISFVTPLLGWTVNSSGQIWKTSDGGKSWTNQLQTNGYFRSIKFADSLNGWAGTLDSSNVLYYTNDGGNNWTLVTNLSSPKPKRVCGLFAVNKNIIYGSGAFDGPAVVIKTTDGGITWQSIDMSKYATNLIDCYFINKDSGFVVGGSPNAVFNESNGTTKAVVFFTSDGGNSWVTRYTGQTLSEWGWKIVFPIPSVGYVSVENFNSGSILKSIDGGVSWKKYDVPGANDLEGIGFIDEATGWVGFRGSNKSFNAMFTNSGGINWQSDSVGEHLNRFQFFGDTLAYAAGITIYKYSAQNVSGIKPEATQPKSFFLSQNYPNPFNPSTTIGYTLPYSARVLIRIYDGLGKELRTILDKEQSAGKHSVVWDGKNADGITVSSGPYIYRIDAGNNAESKMMMMLK